MSITEASRFQLRTAIGQILSEEAADTLMELLPPVGWADVATKTDLQHLRDELKAEIHNLRVATKTDLQHLRDELKADMLNLRNEFKADIQALQLSFETTLEKRLHEQTKWFITTMIAMNAVTVAVAVALSKLI
ncbi:MAG: hypothetical protein RL280_1357 [Actinomycetota bacterium]|jgi:ribosomal protein L29